MVGMRAIRVCFAAIILIMVVSAGFVWLQRPNVWSPETQISMGSGDSRIVDVAADNSGGLLVVWEDSRADLQQVYLKRSNDNGITWSQDVQLSNLSYATIDPLPRVAFDVNRIFVFFSGRTNNGEHLFEVTGNQAESNFSRQEQLTNDPGYQTNPAVAVVGTTIHLVWQGYANGTEHIYYMRSTDAGATWLPAIALTQSSAQDRHPAIIAVNRNVFVVWDRFNDGPEALFFIASLDDGATWQPEVQVSEYAPPVLSIFPSIASNGTYVHAVWNRGQVLYSRSIDAGATWDQPFALTNESRQYLAPRISESGGSLRVVTAAINAGALGGISSDIYYLESSNAGKNWTAPISITVHSSSRFSLSPAIAVRNDDIFVTWEDNRNGHFAIFIASKPNFSQLQTLQRQLSIGGLAALGAATVVYLILETVLRRKRRVRVRRLRRKRRKSGASRRVRR
jgi:hypothetical protein